MQNITVGEITGGELSHNYQGILFNLLIFRKYAALVCSSTRFYNFFGFAVIAGGISCFTPGPGTKVKPGRKFVLYRDDDTASLDNGIHLTIHLDRAAGVRAKTPIKFQGIEIGLVKKLHFSPDMRGVIADCLVN